jgi:hypothetical protein
MEPFISKRASTARIKGRLGGLASARNQDQEQLKQRSTNAGNTTRDKYGVEYYRYLRSLQPKLKSTKEKTEQVIRKVIPASEPLPVNTVQLMQAAAKQLA